MAEEQRRVHVCQHFIFASSPGILAEISPYTQSDDVIANDALQVHSLAVHQTCSFQQQVMCG